MTKGTFLLVLTSVVLSALAQIILKSGMAASAIQTSLTTQSGILVVTTIFSSWRILAGLSVYFLSAAVWLLVLSRMDVSLAYPFVGLGFVITMLLGWLVRGEILSLNRVTGTLLIVTGIFFVARSA